MNKKIGKIKARKSINIRKLLKLRFQTENQPGRSNQPTHLMPEFFNKFLTHQKRFSSFTMSSFTNPFKETNYQLYRSFCFVCSGKPLHVGGIYLQQNAFSPYTGSDGIYLQMCMCQICLHEYHKSLQNFRVFICGRLSINIG